MTTSHRGGRPAVHVTAPTGWLNDPLGITCRDGRYHLFYQAVPDSLGWQPWCSWGHCTSTDLVTWTAHPTALSPGDGDHGCWSGSVVTATASAPATMFYSSVNPPNLQHAAIRVAHAQDEQWQTWHKGEVVIAQPPAGVHVFRDPFVLRDGEAWRMLVGAGYEDGRPAVLTYVSDDLASWRFDGALLEGERTEGFRLSAWECPNLIEVDGRDVLIVSTWGDDRTLQVIAAVGDRVGGRFAVETWHELTQGSGHYAPTTFTDAEGRPCLMFWIREVADEPAGWSGALSVPYRLAITDGELRLEPHPAVLAAAAADGEVSVFTLPAGGSTTTVIVDGPVVEVCTGSAVLGLARTT
ncbi:MAG: glycoside hydrolase family 32 protein [Kineosporiaceae bacterium]|nr:glycoside hydrolase family 32 protein [Kineosporiaceae bacterium]